MSLSKLQKLVALAVSAPEEEARNAALAAVKLIQKGKLTVRFFVNADGQLAVDEVAPPAPVPAPPPPARPEAPETKGPGPLHWRPMTMDDVAHRGRPWCDFVYQGCPKTASWVLSSADHVTIAGHLCEDHVPRTRVKARRRTPNVIPPPPPATPLDVARAAAESFGNSFGRESARSLAGVARGVVRNVFGGKR